MTDDTIRSMKEQMIPSEDIVSDLLAKIAALEASPENMDNVRSFNDSTDVKDGELRVKKPRKHASKFTTKSIWFYSAAAGILVLLSTFVMFGGLDADDAKNTLDGIINNPDVIIDSNDVIENPDGNSAENSNIDNADNTESEDNADNDKKGGFFYNLFHRDDDKSQDEVNDKDSNSSDGNVNSNNGNTTDDSSKQDDNLSTDTPNSGDNSDNSTPENGDSSAITAPPAQNGDDSDRSTVEVDDSKVTPGAPGESDISWQREILAESSVASITVSGTNYVVDSVASSPSVASSEIKSISLEIPATSTTNHTTVRARVKTVKNVSSDLMVALDANGFKETLLYTNKDYKPDTLGQFISDAGLESNTSFAKTVYCKGEKIGYSSYKRFNIDNMSSLVSKYIFKNENAALSDYSSYKNGNIHVLFKSNSNPTCSVIDFGVSDNGYLYVKMASANTFTFYIGESNANSFISHITGE